MKGEGGTGSGQAPSCSLLLQIYCFAVQVFLCTTQQNTVLKVSEKEIPFVLVLFIRQWLLPQRHPSSNCHIQHNKSDFETLIVNPRAFSLLQPSCCQFERKVIKELDLSLYPIFVEHQTISLNESFKLFFGNS